MKLAFIKQKFVSFGGGEGYLSRLLQAAGERGHEVHLVTTAWPEGGDLSFTRHTVAVTARSGSARFRQFSRASAERIRALQPDLAFTLERTEGATLWRAGEGVHRVWLQRRQSFEPGWKTTLARCSSRQRSLVELEAACVRDVRGIIANSRTVADDLQSIYADLQVPVEVIHNGIDLGVFSTRDRAANRERVRGERGVAGTDKVLLFVGSGFLRKGLRESLQVLNRLPDIRLWVIGRDRTEPWLRLAAKLGVADQVHFFKPRPDLVPLYHAADLLLFPSWFESFGFVGLEAAACGTPVVTTRYAGVHERIVEGVGGRVIPKPSDREALVAAVGELLADTPAPEAVAASVADATIEANLDHTLRFIEQTADRSGSPST